VVSGERVQREAWSGLRKADTAGLLRERLEKYSGTTAGIYLAESLAWKLWEEQKGMIDKTEDGVNERRITLLDEGITVLSQAVEDNSSHPMKPMIEKMLESFRAEREWIAKYGEEILASKAPVLKDIRPEPHKMEKAKQVDDKTGNLSVVTLKTDRGEIVVELFEDDAPNHVANFISLVCEGFYDGLVWHRVEDWVIQTGDPEGTGAGGPGYKIDAEITKHGHDRGAFGMARSEAMDSAGSQFYIVKKPQHDIDGKYTIFGRVLSGMDVADRIKKGDKLTEITLDVIRAREYRPRVVYTGPKPTHE
jgi:peptidyl-prolyl cis-trans isomerase B (cyclophilin B)